LTSGGLLGVSTSVTDDTIDTLLGFEFGLTATEWIEHQYKTGKRGVREVLDDLQDRIID
jgi:hypothetical protein